jgi:hypothetical protein
MHLAKLAIPLSVCALAAPSLGCTVGVEGGVGPPPVTVAPATGTLTVRWLVGGTTNPALCDAYGATMMELVVYDSAGNQIATANAPCASFSLTLTLAEGTYTAEATLVDASSSSRSVTKPLDAIVVVMDTDLAIDIDFPSTSILP